VNFTTVETVGVSAASCCDWPGQNCSSSGSVMSSGVVMAPASSITE
jgi:hypothetical protein